MDYKVPVSGLIVVTTDVINSDGTKYYPRLRDSQDKYVYPAYDGNYNLVGLAFCAPNIQFPDKMGQVITDFNGTVLSSKLTDYTPDNSPKEQPIIPQWMREKYFR